MSSKDSHGCSEDSGVDQDHPVGEVRSDEGIRDIDTEDYKGTADGMSYLDKELMRH